MKKNISEITRSDVVEMIKAMLLEFSVYNDFVTHDKLAIFLSNIYMATKDVDASQNDGDSLFIDKVNISRFIKGSNVKILTREFLREVLSNPINAFDTNKSYTATKYEIKYDDIFDFYTTFLSEEYDVEKYRCSFFYKRQLTIDDKKYDSLVMNIHDNTYHIFRQEFNSLDNKSEYSVDALISSFTKNNNLAKTFETNIKKTFSNDYKNGEVLYWNNIDTNRSIFYNLIDDILSAIFPERRTKNRTYIGPEYFWEESNIILRGKNVEEILNVFNKNIDHKANIVLYGGAGNGKTSISHLIYTKFKNIVKDNVWGFNKIGWISYNKEKSFDDNLLRNIDLFKSNRKKEETRVKEIVEYLTSGNDGKTILFIDNFDVDIQNPVNFNNITNLLSFAKSSQVSLIITSRSSQFNQNYYITKEVKPLDENDSIIMFNHYYNDENKNIKIDDDEILNIVKRAYGNPLVIYILAMYAKEFNNLHRYWLFLEKIGFNFNFTNINGDEENAAQMLRKLLNIETCSQIQKELLWLFSFNPNTELSILDINELLAAECKSDVENLHKVGWIVNNNGFSMHPLVCSIVHLSGGQINNCPSCDIGINVVNAISKGIIKKEDDYQHNLFKLNVVNNFVIELDINEMINSKIVNLIMLSDMFCNLSNYCFYFHMINDCFNYGFWNIKVNQDLYNNGYKDRLFNLALAHDTLGYYLSTSGISYYEESNYHISEAIKILEQLDSTFEIKRQLSAAYDHKGYLLLSNQNKKDEQENIQILKLLEDAVHIRKELAEIDNSPVYKIDYAWSLDNLGSFLIDYDSNEEYAVRCLEEALKIRLLYSGSDEIGWTYCNLATLYAKYQTRTPDYYFQKAINYRLNECRERSIEPFTVGLAYTFKKLAQYLSKRTPYSERNKVESWDFIIPIDENDFDYNVPFSTLDYYYESLREYELLDNYNPGSYIAEVIIVKEEILKYISANIKLQRSDIVMIKEVLDYFENHLIFAQEHKSELLALKDICCENNISFPSTLDKLSRNDSSKGHSNFTFIYNIDDKICSVEKKAKYITYDSQNGISNLPDKYFWGYTSAEKVTLGNITGIGNSTFYSCVSLQEIKIPESVEYIGDKAFMGCVSLKRLYLPKHLSKYSNTMLFHKVNIITY